MANHTLDDKIDGTIHPKKGGRGLAYKIISGLAVGAMLLSACTKPVTPTIEPSITATDSPAITQIYTPEPSPTPTATSAPTATLAPLALGDFSAQLEGVGNNGAMACYTYNGAASDLDNLALAADIFQGSRKIESAIPSQQIDGKTCFEVVDAKYVSSVDPTTGMLAISEDPIRFQIKATSPDSRAVTNGTQTLDLGKYIQFPFLSWIYDTQKVCIQNKHDGYIAWDFLPYPTSEHPQLVGTPVLAPLDGFVLVTPGASASSGQNYSVMIYSPATGYMIELIHNAPYFITPEGKFIETSSQRGSFVEAGDIVGMIGLKDAASSIPHTHVRLMIPSIPIDVSGGSTESSDVSIYNQYVVGNIFLDIDFISSRLFLDDAVNNYLNNLPNSGVACRSFAWGNLPTVQQQLPFVIDGKAGDWAAYTPLLTDASGDSLMSSVMDFTALYTARDDNFLYIMIKAGVKPSLWDLQLNFDTNSENQCGAADRLIHLIYEDAQSTFRLGKLAGCEADDSSLLPHTGSTFVWDDVIEMKIPLSTLGDYGPLNLTSITGHAINNSNEVVTPDTMP